MQNLSKQNCFLRHQWTTDAGVKDPDIIITAQHYNGTKTSVLPSG
jgi:hypothetical protein